MYECIYLLTSTRPFFIFLTRVPNFNVCKDSEPNFSVGETQTIITILLFPPNESDK